MSKLAGMAPTQWQAAVLQQLARLLELPEQPQADWEVQRPTKFAYRVAVDLVSELDVSGLPAPKLAPDRKGGIQFEWEKSSCNLEIEITPAGALEFLLTRPGNADEEGFVGLVRARELVESLANL